MTGKDIRISEKSWNDACKMAREIMESQLTASDVDVNRSALQYLIDWIYQNDLHYGRDAMSPCYGFFSDNEEVVYVFPSAFNEALKAGNYSERKTRR